MPATLLKESLWHRCFPVNFAKFLRTPFFTKHLQWLLLIQKHTLPHMLILIMTSQLSKLMEWFKRTEHDYSMKYSILRNDQSSAEVNFDTNYINDNKLSNKEVRIY